MAGRGVLFALSHEGPWRRRILLGVCLLIALGFHLLLLALGTLNWIPSFSPSKPLEVSSIPSQEVNRLKQKWKEKGLILDSDQAQKSSPPPPDAKYMSKHNRRVERQERARDSSTLPTEKNPPVTKGTSRIRSLNQLGIPLSPPPSDSNKTNSGEKNQESRAQTILDKQIPEGSENLLNTQESVYYSFYSRIYQTIVPLWESQLRSNHPKRIAPGDYYTEVEVVLDDAGSLRRIRQIRGSGIHEFDEAAQRAWERVDRFPNPPRGLLDDHKMVHTGWTFHVQVSEGLNFNYTAPTRNY